MTAAWIFVAWILLDVLICAAWILWRDHEKRMDNDSLSGPQRPA